MGSHDNPNNRHDGPAKPESAPARSESPGSGEQARGGVSRTEAFARASAAVAIGLSSYFVQAPKAAATVAELAHLPETEQIEKAKKIDETFDLLGEAGAEHVARREREEDTGKRGDG